MITKQNEIWIDKNNNSWDCDIFTKEQAEKFSKSLINCRGCRDCRDCRGCRDCRDCSDCRYFKSNPQRYTGCNMGSRNSQTTTYWLNEKTQVVCGCYTGTLEEFEKRIQEVHGSNEYGKQYQKYIAIVKKIMEMEKK